MTDGDAERLVVEARRVGVDARDVVGRFVRVAVAYASVTERPRRRRDGSYPGVSRHAAERQRGRRTVARPRRTTRR